MMKIIQPTTTGLLYKNEATPQQIFGASLAIALDARIGVARTGDAVTSWTNYGLAGVGDASQGTAIRQPRFVENAVNGRPAIQGRPDGVNASYMSIPDTAALDYTNFTIFMVYSRLVDTGGTELIGGKYATAGQFEHAALISNVDRNQINYTTDGTTPIGVADTTNTVSTSAPRATRHEYTGAAMQTQTNGFAESSNAVSAVIFQGTSPYNFFSRADFTFPYAGYLAAYYFVTKAASTEEVAATLNYIQRNWGV